MDAVILGHGAGVDADGVVLAVDKRIDRSTTIPVITVVAEEECPDLGFRSEVITTGVTAGGTNAADGGFNSVDLFKSSHPLTLPLSAGVAEYCAEGFVMRIRPMSGEEM